MLGVVAPKNYLTRKGGAEHDDLLVRPAIVNDAHDLRFESHVEESVGFVQNQVCYSSEIGHSPGIGRQHVDHSAWRANDDLGASLQFGDLLGDAGAAVNANGPKMKKKVIKVLKFRYQTRCNLYGLACFSKINLIVKVRY